MYIEIHKRLKLRFRPKPFWNGAWHKQLKLTNSFGLFMIIKMGWVSHDRGILSSKPQQILFGGRRAKTPIYVNKYFKLP